MFGGLAFLIGGNMALAASGQGGLLVHVDPTEGEKFIAKGKAHPLVMRGREMSGWLRLESTDVRTKRDVSKWVKVGATHERSLPAKKSRLIQRYRTYVR